MSPAGITLSVTRSLVEVSLRATSVPGAGPAQLLTLMLWAMSPLGRATNVTVALSRTCRARSAIVERAPLIRILVLPVTTKWKETPLEAFTNTDLLLGSMIEIRPVNFSGVNKSHMDPDAAVDR